MKLNPFNSPAYLIPAFALMSLPLAHATDFVWDGPATGNWSTNTNWDTDTAPDNSGTITIGSGNVVTYDSPGPSDTFLSNATLNLDGELARAGVLRLNGATFNVGSTGVISGGFRDLNNATLNFQDGAQFTASNWEHKGTNVFDFTLSSSGFTAIGPGTLRSNSAVSTTYRADLAGYGGATQDVTLVNFGSDATGLTNATFTGGGQYTLAIDNTGSNAARLYWDDANDAVKLSINETVTWTGNGGDGKLSTAANWDTPDNKAPIANDNLLINNGDTVAHAQFLPGNATINLVGSELTTDGSVIRLNEATINVDAGSTLSGAFWDLDGASIVFEDGAQATMESWEQKDINSFTYQLGAYDFTTLTPDRFLIGKGSLTGDIANATYIADFSNFANWSLSNLGSNSITLMDFATDFASMDNAKFQGASFDYINMGANIENAAFAWDNSLEAITLTFDITAVPEPSSTTLLGLGGLALMLRRKRS
jgi:hypothetical protein